MKQISNKKFIIITITIVLIILISLIVISLLTNKVLKKQAFQKTYKQGMKEEIIVDGISCKVLDNTNEKLKTFVTIARESGIENIEYVADNGEIIKLDCNNKTKVTIDIEMGVDEKRQFKVTSNGKVELETAILNDDYIDDYVKFIKLDNDNPYDQVDIEFTPVQASLNYYRINKGPWIAYSSTLSFDLSSVDIEKLLNDEYETTIYTMSVDSAGNTLMANKTIELTKKYPNFNLFYNMDISGKIELAEYTLRVTSWSGTDSNWRWFEVRAMGGGHYRNSGSFNVVITMDWNKPDITFDSITTTFALYAEDNYSKSRGAIVINYTDGSSTSSGTGTFDRRGTVYWNAEVQPDKNKKISKIQFICSGSDALGDGSWSRVNEVYFKGIQKVNT